MHRLTENEAVCRADDGGMVALALALMAVCGFVVGCGVALLAVLL